MNPQQKRESFKFLSRISKSGDKLFVNIPLELHDEVEAYKDKPLSVTLKEVVLE